MQGACPWEIVHNHALRIARKCTILDYLPSKWANDHDWWGSFAEDFENRTSILRGYRLAIFELQYIKTNSLINSSKFLKYRWFVHLGELGAFIVYFLQIECASANY